MLRIYLGSFFRLSICAIALAFVTPSALTAKEAQSDASASLKQRLQTQFPDMKIIDVQPANVGSLYEVFTGKSLFYTDKSGQHLIYGDVVDVGTKKSVTMDRLNQRNAIDFASLPFERAIKVVKGSGTRKLATFTDPDCPYCRKLEEEMKSVNDFTLYVFLFPLTKIHPNAERHSKAIWCASDRAAAWTSWMLESKEPPEVTCDGDPVKELSVLADKLNISGTPTLYFENGHRFAGMMTAAELDRALSENAVVKATKAHGGTPNGAVPNGAGGGDSTLTAGCKAPTSNSDAPSEPCTR